MTSAGSYDNRTKLKGTEANAPETHDTVYHSGHREFLVFKAGTKRRGLCIGL